MNKHYEWKQVRYGSEPSKGDNIFWSDATGLGNGDLVANFGTEHHEQVRLIIHEHNETVRELQGIIESLRRD